MSKHIKRIKDIFSGTAYKELEQQIKVMQKKTEQDNGKKTKTRTTEIKIEITTSPEEDGAESDRAKHKK